MNPRGTISYDIEATVKAEKDTQRMKPIAYKIHRLESVRKLVKLRKVYEQGTLVRREQTLLAYRKKNHFYSFIVAMLFE